MFFTLSHSQCDIEKTGQLFTIAAQWSFFASAKSACSAHKGCVCVCEFCRLMLRQHILAELGWRVEDGEVVCGGLVFSVSAQLSGF